MVIGCLPFISFALPLRPPGSPAGAAPSGPVSFIAVRSHGAVGGGGAVKRGAGQEEARRGEDVLQRGANRGSALLDARPSAVEYLMEPGVFI